MEWILRKLVSKYYLNTYLDQESWWGYSLKLYSSHHFNEISYIQKNAKKIWNRLTDIFSCLLILGWFLAKLGKTFFYRKVIFVKLRYGTPNTNFSLFFEQINFKKTTYYMSWSLIIQQSFWYRMDIYKTLINNLWIIKPWFSQNLKVSLNMLAYDNIWPKSNVQRSKDGGYPRVSNLDKYLPFLEQNSNRLLMRILSKPLYLLKYLFDKNIA